MLRLWEKHDTHLWSLPQYMWNRNYPLSRVWLNWYIELHWDTAWTFPKGFSSKRITCILCHAFKRIYWHSCMGIRPNIMYVLMDIRKNIPNRALFKSSSCVLTSQCTRRTLSMSHLIWLITYTYAWWYMCVCVWVCASQDLGRAHTSQH